MKSIYLLVTIAFSTLSTAQIGNGKDWAIIAVIMSTRIECTSLDNKAFFSFGTKIPIKEKNYVSFRGHFNWWDIKNRKLIVIPELDYIRNIAAFEKDHAIITSLYTGAGITPYTISPKFGVSFYHFFTAELGQNFEFNQYKHFPLEGFRFSFGINLIF